MFAVNINVHQLVLHQVVNIMFYCIDDTGRILLLLRQIIAMV